MATPFNMAPPQGQPVNIFPSGFMQSQPQCLVQPNLVCPQPVPFCQLPAHFVQQQMHMQLQLQLQMQTQMQAAGCNCAAYLAAMGLSNHSPKFPPYPPLPTGTPLPGSSGLTPGDSQLQKPNPGPVLNTPIVSSVTPMPNPGPLSNAHTVSCINPMANPTQAPVQLPHLPAHSQPNSMSMSNNNMHIAAQQYALSQHLAFAATNTCNPAQNPICVQTHPYFHCLENNFPTLPSGSSMPSQTNNQQIVPPQSSTAASLPTYNNPQALPPPTPPYPPPNNVMLSTQKTSVAKGVISNMPPFYAQTQDKVLAAGHVQNQAQISNQFIPSHPPRTPEQTQFISPPLPLHPHPTLVSNPAFASNTRPTGQTFNPTFVGQNVVEVSQMAAAHSLGNIAFQGAGPTAAHQNPHQLHQLQQNMHSSSLQPSEGSSNDQDATKNFHKLNDTWQHQNGTCNRGFSSGICGRDEVSGYTVHSYVNGDRMNMDKRRRGEDERKPDFSPNSRIFDKRPSRNQKDTVGSTNRSHAGTLINRSCDRSFTHKQHMEESFNSRIKCDEEDCSFEASGKKLKQHKLLKHGKPSRQASVAAQRAAPLQSKETMDEIQQWCEERKRNYPTQANIQRKAQQIQERKARGELIDEDAKKRRQRLREILAKQAELGVEVADVPADYIMDCHPGHKGPRERRQQSETSRKVPINEASLMKARKSHPDKIVEIKELGTDESSGKVPRLEDLTSPRSVLNDVNIFKVKEPGETIRPVKPASFERVDDNDKAEGLGSAEQSDTMANDKKHQCNRVGKKSQTCQAICRFFQRGHCLNGVHCKYLHVPKSDCSHKQTTLLSEPSKRKPTLLEKLLSGEIKREKSHLLQVFRFMVSNSFFTEWPNKPLTFFQCSGEAPSINPKQGEGQLGAINGSDEAHVNVDEGYVAEKNSGCEKESRCCEDFEEGEIEEGEIEDTD